MPCRLRPQGALVRRTRPLLGLLMIAALLGAGACTTTDPGTASTTSSATATAIGTEADLKALEGVTVTEAPLSASPTANSSTDATTSGTVPTATATATATTTTTPAGTAPVLTLANTPLTVSATTRRIVAAGSGPLSGPDSLVSAHLSVSLGSTGQQLDSTYRLNEPVKLAMSNPETIAGLLTGLTGVQARSRVLVAIPPDEAYGSQGNPQVGISGTETLLVLADIVAVATPLSQAEGTHRRSGRGPAHRNVRRDYRPHGHHPFRGQSAHRHGGPAARRGVRTAARVRPAGVRPLHRGAVEGRERL